MCLDLEPLLWTPASQPLSQVCDDICSLMNYSVAQSSYKDADGDHNDESSQSTAHNSTNYNAKPLTTVEHRI